MKSLAKIRKLVNSNVCAVTFIKKSNGHVRNIFCTSNLDNIPKKAHPTGNGKMRNKKEQIRCFDMQENGWRSFNYDTIESICTIEEFKKNIMLTDDVLDGYMRNYRITKKGLMVNTAKSKYIKRYKNVYPTSSNKHRALIYLSNLKIKSLIKKYNIPNSSLTKSTLNLGVFEKSINASYAIAWFYSNIENFFKLHKSNKSLFAKNFAFDYDSILKGKAVTDKKKISDNATVSRMTKRAKIANANKALKYATSDKKIVDVFLVDDLTIVNMLSSTALNGGFKYDIKDIPEMIKSIHKQANIWKPKSMKQWKKVASYGLSKWKLSTSMLDSVFINNAYLRNFDINFVSKEIEKVTRN